MPKLPKQSVLVDIMKKPEILIICPFFRPNLGGVETHLDHLTWYLNKNGYKTTVLTYKPLTIKSDYLPYEKEGNLEIHRFWWLGAYWWFDKTTPYPIVQYLYVVPGLLFSSFWFLLKNHRRFEVVHAHGFTAAFVARVLDFLFPFKRMVVSTHFIYRKIGSGNLYSRIFNWVLKGFNKILLVNKESGKELKGIGADPNKMEVFCHWLDQNIFIEKDKKVSRALLRLPDNGKLLVLYVGRMIKMKGIFEILQAAVKLQNKAYFIFLGDGPDFTEFKKRASGVRNVFTEGRKSQLEVIDYLGACDFLLLPSLAKEAQPMVVMEALSCGRPVVATNKGAIAEMIDSSVGIIISPTSRNIKKTISYLINNPQKLKEMTKKSRNYALQKFGEKNAEIIINSYHD